MIKYYSLDSIPFSICSKFVVFFSGETRYFLVFQNKHHFISEYKKKPSFSRHYYEVISTEFRKMVLDIDIFLTEKEIIYVNQELERLIFFLTKEKVSNLIFRSADSKKTTYHIVVPKLMFTVEECKYIVNKLDSKQELFDRGVYKKIQFFRIEGSTKYQEKRYKYLLNEDKISEQVFEGLVGDKCCKKEKCKYCYNQSISNNKHNFVFNLSKNIKSSNTEVVDNLFPKIKNQFRIRNQVDKYLISLTRINKGYCPLCERIHEKENGYIVFKKGKWNFYCFRNNKSTSLLEHC